MAEIILNVDVRDGVGTGGARAARRAGAVPGVLYGGGKAPVAISVNEKRLPQERSTPASCWATW
jgi:large subunit ribosomal protein L25